MWELGFRIKIMDVLKSEVFSSLQKKICETESLLLTCGHLAGNKGQRKLRKKIEAELHFMKKLSNYPAKLKEEHQQSSNLCHLSAIIKCCSELSNVVKILEPFIYEEIVEFQNESISVEKRITIDIVADHGKTWVKVVAQNPVSLLQSSLGAGKFGRRSITDQVKDIISCAAQNRHMYTNPKVIVWFAAGIVNDLKVLLEKMNVVVIAVKSLLYISSNELHSENEKHMEPSVGTTSIAENITERNKQENNIASVYVSQQGLQISHSNIAENKNFASSYTGEIFLSENSSSCAYNTQANINLDCIPHDILLNLDVSTMIAEVSNLTNGHCNIQFKEKILIEQAMREGKYPMRKLLDKLLKGHKLICCQTAHNDFLEILSTVGGEEEKRRASEFLKNVIVVPDKLSEKALLLQTSNKVREHTMIIFGTGDSLKAVTVTANLGFLRAAQSQGIKFVAFVHESRALTELKENDIDNH